jgi:serine/threonine protein kinase
VGFDFSAWRAPETFQSVDFQVVSEQTDVYMFGGFMFEVLTGQTPWSWLQQSEIGLRRATSTASVVDDARSSGHLTYIVEDAGVKGSYVEALEALMCKCLSTLAWDRPAMVAIFDELERIELFSQMCHAYL